MGHTASPPVVFLEHVMVDEPQVPPHPNGGMRLSFGQSSVHLGGRYLSYILIIGIIWIAPHALTYWVLGQQHDTLMEHRVEVAKFLSGYAGRKQVEEHISLMVEAH